MPKKWKFWNFSTVVVWRNWCRPACLPVCLPVHPSCPLIQTGSAILENVQCALCCSHYVGTRQTTQQDDILYFLTPIINCWTQSQTRLCQKLTRSVMIFLSPHEKDIRGTWTKKCLVQKSWERWNIMLFTSCPTQASIFSAYARWNLQRS